MSKANRRRRARKRIADSIRDGLRRQSPAPRRPKVHDPYAEIGVRTHAEPPDWEPKVAELKATPATALVVLTQPRDEPGEPLDFGCFAVLGPRLEDILAPESANPFPSPEPLEVGVFHADDAPAARVAELAEECRSLGLPPPISRKAFLERMHQLCWEQESAFVAFHVPTEIGRLAVYWARAVRDPGRGGFTQILWTRPGKGTRRHPILANGEIENPRRPRIVEKAIDGHRADVRFKPPKGKQRYRAGVFTSLLPLAEVHSGMKMDTLAQACAVFEIEPPPASDGSVAALVAQLRASGTLYVELLARHREISPDRPPQSWLSAGLYARTLLERMELEPPLLRCPDFARDVLSRTASAYFSGDLFVHARTSGLPVMTLDFQGAYSLAAILVGGWDILSAARLDVVEEDGAAVAARVHALAEKIRRFSEGLGEPPTLEEWQDLAWTTVEVDPEGAVLPVRSKRGETWTVRRRPLRSRRGALWYQALDLVAHSLESAKLPRIVRGSACDRGARPPPPRSGSQQERSLTHPWRTRSLRCRPRHPGSNGTRA